MGQHGPSSLGIPGESGSEGNQCSTNYRPEVTLKCPNPSLSDIPFILKELIGN
jgi:hypothetical protein